MQALSALACCVGCAFSGFASLKIALFIQPLTNENDPIFTFGSFSFAFALFSINFPQFLLTSAVTSISNIAVENAENVIYDITGRRVNEITKAGIYIVNGKKVLVK